MKNEAAPSPVAAAGLRVERDLRQSAKIYQFSCLELQQRPPTSGPACGGKHRLPRAARMPIDDGMVKENK